MPACGFATSAGWPLRDPEPARLLSPDSVRLPDSPGADRSPFILYIEGPRDRSILGAWAYRLLPRVRPLLQESVILGGRRPARALSHFRDRRAGSNALCVLDRDGGETTAVDSEAGLTFFTWGRRHIESYLLVPEAIRRAMRVPDDDHRLTRILERELPARSDAAAWRELDAKRLLARAGPLAQALGRPMPLARIARATREEELHADVHKLFDRLRVALGGIGASRGPQVVNRRTARRTE